MNLSEYLLETVKIVNGLAPSADLYNGSPSTDIINMENYDRVVFLLFQKTSTGNSGTATVTISEVDNVLGSNSTAIAFKYRKNESAGTADTFGALTAATSSGFSTTANKTAIYAMEVRADQLSDGYPCVKATFTETVDDPVIGSVLVLCGGAKQKGATLPTAIA